MTESIGYGKGKRGKGDLPRFYGAVKSNNEVYFQMASLFKEVTKGEKGPSRQWLYRILKSRASLPNSSGKIFFDVL